MVKQVVGKTERKQGEVDARVDDVSKEILNCGDGNLFGSVVASEYEFEVADSEFGIEAARKLKLAEESLLKSDMLSVREIEDPRSLLLEWDEVFVVEENEHDETS